MSLFARNHEEERQPHECGHGIDAGCDDKGLPIVIGIHEIAWLKHGTSLIMLKKMQSHGSGIEYLTPKSQAIANLHKKQIEKRTASRTLAVNELAAHCLIATIIYVCYCSHRK